MTRIRLSVLTTACIASLSTLGALPVPAQSPRRSAPITEIAYEVTADSAAVGRRQLGVAMTFRVAGRAPVLLALPAWSPGHYTLLWFARRVAHFAAQSGGAPLEWRKVDFRTWEITPRDAEVVRVTFDYQADAVDRAVAWTAPDFAFFNGTNLFLYPVGRGFDWPAQVAVRTEAAWRVTTGMDSAPAGAGFAAQNYHDLVDMPFYVGRHALDSAQVAGHWFRLAWYPARSLTPARRDRTFEWLRRIAPAEVAVFGEAPFRNYTLFQRSDTVVNGGGLEHQSSQVDEVLTSQLDGAGLSGLYAHELFHAWNVKRLRPSDLVPYRYDDAQQTPWLWVSEGITDYYADLALVRGGVTDSVRFFDAVAGKIATVQQAPPTALADASLSAWIAPMDGSGGLYYPKGSLAGLLIDIMIRDASDNRRSLDTVMRRLYEQTYKHGRGFTSAEWWGEVSRAAGGRSFADFAKRYVEGREPMPFGATLALAGLSVVGDSVREPRLGIATATDSGGTRVTDVSATGAAAGAGLRVGDYVVSVGGVAIRDDDASFAAFRAGYAGTSESTVPLVVRRGDQTVTLTLPVRLVTRVRVRVLPVPEASEKAVRIRNGILRGVG